MCTAATAALATLSLLLPPACRALLPAAPAPVAVRSRLAKRRALPSRTKIGAHKHAAVDGDASDEEDDTHLNGIGVGIDLGTTNSALAMMVPAEDGSSRTVPTMIEVDHDGRTIPSVVSFVTFDENDGTSSEQLSLPPWTDQAVATSAGTSIEWPEWNAPYQIHVGKRAIHDEQSNPNSTYRNVKRIMGTGGRMAEMATGVVPNLYIGSINDGTDDSSDVSSESLEDIFDMLEESDEKSKPKGKKKKGKKKGNKWKRKKQSELPKLHKQLEEARDDPALLTCKINPINGDATKSAAEVLLRPEQIAACILRKLYDAAESHRQTRSNEGAKVVTRAVIGVPAYFTDAQRQATVRASELAGVPKVKLLPEPEAAALAYGAASTGDGDDGTGGHYDAEELILVFDLGGGTFDVSVLEVGGGVTEVLATVGNNRLGGADFDKRVAEYLSGCAVEHGRKASSDVGKTNPNGDVFDEMEDDSSKRKTRRRPVKDWYRQGSGEVPDIIQRVAEEARKALSNQKTVEVLVPLTEEGWRRIGGDESWGSAVGPFDTARIKTEHGMTEGDDYTVVSLDRQTFESICYNELQMLLQPIREVAIMAGVLLPGDARPSFVENALAMATAREADGEDFWEFDDNDDFEDDLLVKTGKSVTSIESDASPEEELLHAEALQQIQVMDIKAQKKAQQRGRRKARDIDKRERSFRKQKRSAMEEATTASLLGKQLDRGGKRKRGGGAATAVVPQPTSVSMGNERVQEGIHGRPLSRIVLVGGATRMPVIGKLLEAVVGMVPQRTVNPDEAVALGCAVQVGILDGENEGLLGGAQAVLSPMQAAVMRALGRRRLDVSERGELSMQGGDEMEMKMGGISGMIVDEFDDEDDFY